VRGSSTRRSWAAIVLGALAPLAAAGCQPPPDVSEALIYVETTGGPAPEYLLFSWLYCDSFIKRDDRVPATGQLPRTTNPVATILIQVDAPQPTRRVAFIRGMVGNIAVSFGRSAMDIVPGTRSETTVRLQAGSIPDSMESDGMAEGCAGPPPADAAAAPDLAPPPRDGPADAGSPPDAAPEVNPPDADPGPIELQAGLVGHWKFDEAVGSTSPDSSGRGATAKLLLGTTLVAGRVGAGALDVSGDKDLAEVADPTDEHLDFGTADFTVSVWIRTTQRPTSAPDIVVKWPSNLNPMGPRSGWALTLPQGAIFFKGQTDGGPQMGVTGPLVNDGAWHHVAGRKTATELALWLDGKLIATQPHSFGSVSNTAPLWMGGFGTSDTLEFDGQIDDVRLYGRALGAAEIRALASVPAP
jgi:hypothetical protein